MVSTPATPEESSEPDPFDGVEVIEVIEVDDLDAPPGGHALRSLVSWLLTALLVGAGFAWGYKFTEAYLERG